MGSKKYKINKQTTYLLLYYQENKYGTQTKQKKNEKETFITRKARKKNHTHTNKQKKTHSPKLRTPSFLSHHTNTTSRNTLKHT